MYGSIDASTLARETASTPRPTPVLAGIYASDQPFRAPLPE
jgi:hypothetical protein